MTRNTSTPRPNDAFMVRPLGRKKLAELTGSGMERGDAEHSTGSSTDPNGLCVCSEHAWLCEFCGCDV